MAVEYLTATHFGFQFAFLFLLIHIHIKLNLLEREQAAELTEHTADIGWTMDVSVV